MNYLIIGHTESTETYDGCGEWSRKYGSFERFFFRDDEAGFVAKWAELKFNDEFEDLIIVINGAPDNEMDDVEFEEHERLDKLRAVKHEELYVLKVEIDRVKTEAAANAALEKAREIARKQRIIDLQQLAVLQQKLGITS